MNAVWFRLEMYWIAIFKIQPEPDI